MWYRARSALVCLPRVPSSCSLTSRLDGLMSRCGRNTTIGLTTRVWGFSHHPAPNVTSRTTTRFGLGPALARSRSTYVCACVRARARACVRA